VTEPLTAGHFQAHTGSVFVLTELEPQFELRLVEVTRGGHAGLGREPFGLYFLGPLDPVLPQSTYHFEHEAMGALDIFIVPVARDAEAVRYEAVFN
jgi:hypothetical protein